MYVFLSIYKLINIWWSELFLEERIRWRVIEITETDRRWWLLLYCWRFAPLAPASVPNFLFLTLNIPPPSASAPPKKSTFSLLFSLSNFGASKFFTRGLWISLNSFFFPSPSILNLSEGWEELAPVRPDKCVGRAARIWEYWEVGNEADIGDDNGDCSCLRLLEVDGMRFKVFFRDFGGGRRLWGGGGPGG